MNKFRLRGSLYWDEFAQFLRRNVSPTTVHLRFEGPTRQLPEMVTIMDYNQPYKKGLIHTKYMWDDFARDSIVINAGWLGGEIPIKGSEGEFDEEKMVFTEKMYRGARAVVEYMSREKILEDTEEVREFMEGTSYE